MTRVFETAQASNDGDFQAGDWLLFFGISLIWGASFLLIAESLEAFTPGLVTVGRVGLGAITLLAIRAMREPAARIDAGDRRRVILLAIVWVAVPFTLFPLAQQWINSAVTGLLNGSTPVFVAVLSALLVKVRPTSGQVVGLGLGFLGIVLISLATAGEGVSEAGGVALVLLATVCYGVAFNIAPPLQARYGAVVLMSEVLTIATVLTLPLAFIGFGSNEWSTVSAGALIALGSIGTGIAYWIMTSLVGRIGSIRASFITYLIPVVALVLGIAIRGDDVGLLALVGAPLTIAGAFLASRRAA